MKGVYKFYQNDELIHEQENSLTISGRALLVKSLLGLIPSIGGSIAVGVDNTANPSPNSDNLIDLNSLSFAIAESPVNIATVGTANSRDALVFKTTLEDSAKYTIYEVGLYPEKFVDQITGFTDVLILNGESDDAWKVNISSTEYLLSDRIAETSGSRIVNTGSNYRIGDEAALVDASQTIYTTSFINNFSAYSQLDVFKIAGYASGSTTVTIKFMKSDATYYSKQWSIASSGYKILSVNKNDFTATIASGASLDWSDVVKISITAGSASFIFDGMKFDDADSLSTNYGLISRAALSTPLQKKAGEPLTIEYYLAVAFNEAT